MKWPRLLPQSDDLGWTPYAWLVYLAMLLVFLLLGPADGVDWIVSGVLVVIFLPLYFRGFWLRGRAALRVVVAIASLGSIGIFFNAGASVFWIFGGAFLARVAEPKIAFRLLVLLVLAIGLQSAVFSLHPGIWLPGIVFTLLVGAINIHYDEVGRKNRALRLAHDEVRRLARTAERERIARDLHDLLGHTLSVIVLKSELASRLAEREPDRATREIREVEQISRNALREVRLAVEGYRSGGLSLREEVENARRVLASADIETQVEEEDVPEHLSVAGESVLALALREAVTNIVRHSEALSCRIRIAFADREARLEVSDDGRGGEEPEGSGLSGMRERVEAQGGRLLRETVEGTRLVVTLPCLGDSP